MISEEAAEFWYPVVSYTFMGTWCLLIAGGLALRLTPWGRRVRETRRRAVIAAAVAVVLFSGFVGALSVLESRDVRALSVLWFVVPIAAGVMTLNVLRTKFCDGCGKASYQHGFGGYSRCPRCGRAYGE